MRLRNLVVLLLLASLAAGAIAGCSRSDTAAYGKSAIKDVTVQDAAKLIQQNKGNPEFVVLDVRTPQEFAEGHLEGAIQIDFYASDFRDKLDRLDRSKTYLVYCRSGHRSRAASDIMQELGFKKGYNMLGGFLDWKSAGLLIAK